MGRGDAVTTPTMSPQYTENDDGPIAVSETRDAPSPKQGERGGRGMGQEHHQHQEQSLSEPHQPQDCQPRTRASSEGSFNFNTMMMVSTSTHGSSSGQTSSPLLTTIQRNTPTLPEDYPSTAGDFDRMEPSVENENHLVNHRHQEEQQNRPIEDSLRDESALLSRYVPEQQLNQEESSISTNHRRLSSALPASTSIVRALFGPGLGPCWGDFSCTYNRIRGRLYATSQAVLFYTNLLGFERRICLLLRDVQHMELFRTTSLRFGTIDGETYIIKSFNDREQVLHLLSGLKILAHKHQQQQQEEEQQHNHHRAGGGNYKGPASIMGSPQRQTRQSQHQQSIAFMGTSLTALTPSGTARRRSSSERTVRTPLVNTSRPTGALPDDMGSTTAPFSPNNSVSDLPVSLASSSSQPVYHNPVPPPPPPPWANRQRAASDSILRFPFRFNDQGNGSGSGTFSEESPKTSVVLSATVVTEGSDARSRILSEENVSAGGFEGQKTTGKPFSSDSMDEEDEDADASMSSLWKQAVQPKDPPLEEIGIDGIVLPCDVDTFFQTFWADHAEHSLEYYQREYVKDQDIKLTGWDLGADGYFRRTLQFIHPIKNSLGLGPSSADTTRQQKMRHYADYGMTLENRTKVSGIPAADSFFVQDHWVLEAHGEGQVKLTVHYDTRFTKRCMFKSIISKSIRKETKEWMAGYADMVQTVLAQKSSIAQRAVMTAGGAGAGDATNMAKQHQHTPMGDISKEVLNSLKAVYRLMLVGFVLFFVLGMAICIYAYRIQQAVALLNLQVCQTKSF